MSTAIAPTPLSRSSIFSRWALRLASLAGKRGVTAARARYDAAQARRPLAGPSTSRPLLPRGDEQGRRFRDHNNRLIRDGHELERVKRGALRLGRLARLQGDTLSALDFVPADQSFIGPYLDTGGQGLGLVAVTRTTEYRGRFKGWKSSAREVYLVGAPERPEAQGGRYWAHRVHRDCGTVAGALSWIWGGRPPRRRQGDIAIVAGPSNRNTLPALPAGHALDEATASIRHPHHAPLPLPGKGERLIVGRRAAESGRGVASQRGD